MNSVIKRKADTYIWYPWAYDWVWEAHCGQIVDTEDDFYLIETVKKNNASFNALDVKQLTRFKSYEIFDRKEECEEYIKNYYYGGLCDQCKYENIFDNASCSNCSKENCDRNGMSCSDLCVKYTDKGNNGYNGWEDYMNGLKDCTFNPDCQHHKNSCHNTCTFEHYENELVQVRVKDLNIHVGDRHVTSITIPRHAWWYGSFKTEKCLLCKAVKYDWILNKNGLPKKYQVKGVSFDNMGMLTFDGELIGEYKEFE